MPLKHEQSRRGNLCPQHPGYISRIAKVGAGGQGSIYNDTGDTHAIADVAGCSRAAPVTPP